jgi:uncharacterized membrane protein YedE/YeeE
MKTSSLLAVLAGGTLFGFGLALSTMIQPEVVLSFLQGRDMGLMLVLGGAASVTAVVYAIAPRLMRKPIFGTAFGVHSLLPRRDTIVGAAIFGVGWGICGVCPGPAIAGLGAGNWPLLYAIVGLALGAFVHGALFGRIRSSD